MPEQGGFPKTHAVCMLVTVGKKPIRIRSNETFWFTLSFPPHAVPSKSLPIRLEMVGTLYDVLSVSPGISPGISPMRSYRQPLYDTEYVLNNNDCLFVDFFRRPCGQSNNIREYKSPLDTNLMQASQLGMPREFDFYGVRANYLPPGSRRDMKRLYFAALLEWYFEGGVWLQAPLSSVPCNGMPLPVMTNEGFRPEEIKDTGWLIAEHRETKQAVGLPVQGKRVMQGD